MSSPDSSKHIGRVDVPIVSQSEPRNRRWWPQIGLSTLLLLTACVAVWSAVWIARSAVARLQLELVQTRSLARELVIKDRARLSIIKQDEMQFDENKWQVYVPRAGLKIHLATAQVNQTKAGMQAPEASADLTPGLHTIELKLEESGEQWLLEIDADLETLISLRKEKAWNPNRGASGGGNFATQAEFDIGAPAVLMQRHFHAPNTKNFATPHPDGNGILLWIE